MTIPRATVRLQMHAGFTLADAQAQVPYFAALGVSHFYLSPIFQARPGSMHGYDVVDHERISDELGGERAFIQLAQSLRAHGMGVILDIVPNHMATHQDNRWWWDVLQHGQASLYADWFDIDWDSSEPGLRGKIMAPFLAEDYGHSMANGSLQLVFDDACASFQIDACGARYPLNPQSLSLLGLDPRQRGDEVQQVLSACDPSTESGQERLHQLLESQHYRLCWWRCAADSINWRRFFEISELIGVRIELPPVFEAVHALPLRLFAQGLIDGVRIDHVDGLAQPLRYCRQLMARLKSCSAQRPGRLKNDAPWLIVEKILAPHETLDERWDVHGSSGYDFMDQAGAILHDASAEKALTSHWNQIAERPLPVALVLEEARRLMLLRHFAAERKALLRALTALAQSRPVTRDWTTQTIARVLDMLLYKFPVYRSYVEGSQRNEHDEAWFAPLREVLRAALEQERDESGIALLPILDEWLGGRADPEAADASSLLRRQVIRRFQQLTPPLAAKSLEDTTFYRYGRLLSRNEVGSSPERFALSSDAFHGCNAAREKQGGQSMLATATHDHKRGEDVRARLAVLTELPACWARTSMRWLRWADRGLALKSGLYAAERYMLLQTVVGAWPLDLSLDDEHARARYVQRLIQWQTKALREAKQSSSWFDPDRQHEQASAHYVRELLTGSEQGLCRDIARFVQRIAPAAAVNSLAQVVLRMTSPGVPDLYQGTEFWDFSLVDPDNRGPVDFRARQKGLQACQSGATGAELLTSWRSGRIKQFVVFRTLQLLREMPEVFARGEYLGLPVVGPRSHHALAYLRILADRYVVVIVPRLVFAGIEFQQELTLPAVSAKFWDTTSVILPYRCTAPCLQSGLSGATHAVGAGGALRLADVFADLPVAILRSA